MTIQALRAYWLRCLETINPTLSSLEAGEPIYANPHDARTMLVRLRKDRTLYLDLLARFPAVA